MRPQSLRMDERNRIKKPLLEQLHGLGWEIVTLTDESQKLAATFRPRGRHQRPT
ncbi:MAG: hypothetical protein J4F42_01065 [Desulfurellaceae bacterium]|nr:hypothetical protein [Desulfurellaceae bacterium]